MRAQRSAWWHLSTLVVCAVWLTACAQRIERRNEAGQMERSGQLVSGLRDGPWVHYHPNGTQQSAGSYVRDVQDGEWTWWYPTGALEMRGSFQDEARKGLWTLWHPDGSLRAQGHFERGFETGLWAFYAAGGVLERRGWFDRGRMTLRWTIHDADGSVKATGHYLAGVMAGAWRTSDPAGVMSSVTYPLPDGVEVVEERDPASAVEAAPRRMGFLRAGRKQGVWVGAHAQGDIWLACDFVDDTPQGLARVVRSDGTLLAHGPVQNGCLQGRWSWDGGARVDTYATARPRLPWSGEWSTTPCAQPACSDVERWLAELSSPLQPAPLLPPAPPAVAPVAETLAVTAAQAPALPARTQPWTEFEEHALPELVKIYGSGTEANLLGMDGYEMPVGRRVELQHPAEVAKPGDHLGKRLPVRTFATPRQGRLDLDQYLGRKHTLVVVLRGFGGQVCVYCTAQTKALAKEAARFAALDTEVLVVFPGPSSGLDAFLEAYERTFGKGERPPYTLAYDSDMKLVEGLGIVDNIAVPSVLLLDKQGLIRWSHVAKDLSDRPSATQILKQLEALSRTTPTTSGH
jgi:antitoxin component YwqK of YwqJK toxin-antitoxin module/peroxiredoxin